jgi:hypothetical protein
MRFDLGNLLARALAIRLRRFTQRRARYDFYVAGFRDGWAAAHGRGVALEESKPKLAGTLETSSITAKF